MNFSTFTKAVAGGVALSAMMAGAAFAEPALIYDLKCPGSEAYIALARELIARLPKPAKAA